MRMSDWSSDVCSSDLRPRSGVGDVTSRLGAVGADRVAQHVATAPHGLAVVVAAGRGGQLLAELADEDVDDLQLRLVHAAVEVVEEHLLGDRTSTRLNSSH